MAIEIRLGNDLVLAGSQILQVKLHTGIDAMYGKLHTDTMELRIRGDIPWEQHALQEQTVRLYWNGQLLATHCIKHCLRREAGEVYLLCRSNADYLQGEFMGGMYEAMDAQILMEQIVGDNPLTVDLYSSIGVLSGYLPICSKAVALHQVAFAIGSMVRIDNRGGLYISSLSPLGQITIPPERIQGDYQLKTRPGYSKIELVTHSYTLSDEWVEILKPMHIKKDEMYMKFDVPYGEYKGLEDAWIQESGLHYVRFFTGDYAGLMGRPYDHETAYHTLQQPAESGFTNIFSVRDNTLLSEAYLPDIMEHVRKRAQWRQELTVTVLVEEEQTGKPVQLPTPWGTVFTGYISRMDSEFLGDTQVARITVVGKEEKEESL